MITALTFTQVLAAFLLQAHMMRAEEQPVPADDPQRDPNYCWTHNMLWPACAEQHNEK
ncbi:hypothetical protein AB0P05_26740 [Streptomyces flaveolus]|uniref:hypothetical protein n=1 Tax=Streptomyces flaveolus TaxID=67297 RepID=UPI003420D914